MAEPIKGAPISWNIGGTPTQEEVIGRGLASCVANLNQWITVLCELGEFGVMTELEVKCCDLFRTADETYETDQ